MNITPIGMPPLTIIDIEFGPPGKLFITTDVFPGWNAAVYEVNYNTTTGAVTTWNVIANNLTIHTFGTGPATSAYRYSCAYAGAGKLYIGASGQNLNEGAWNLLEYDVSTSTLTNPSTPLLAMPLVANQTRWFMNMTVHPNSPEVIYFGGLRPFYVMKQNGVWSKQNVTYASNNVFHDDVRCVKILNSINTPNNPGSADIVYWGNDGGVSKTNGSSCQNLNGTGFYTQAVYDVDAGLTGKKRICAAFDNSMFFTNTASPIWGNSASGDGFNGIYDPRFGVQNERVLYHNGALDWQTYLHNGITMNGAGVYMTTPTSPIEGQRTFIFPHGFVGDKMYLGNKNLFVSQPNGYQPWINTTVPPGALSGNSTTIQDNCRDIALSNQNPTTRQYYGFRWGLDKTKILFAKSLNGWHNITPPPISSGGHNFTNVEVDSKDENRVFVSLGGVNWNFPGNNRVLFGKYDPTSNSITNWQDMSWGLPELPVTKLVYQKGSDDIIYAGTDAGVYRWEPSAVYDVNNPTGCWVKFNETPSGSPMPPVIIHDLVIDYCSGKLVAGSYGRGVWETDLYNPNTFPGYTLKIDGNSTVTWGSATAGVITDKFIEGSILIKSGSTLNIIGNSSNNLAGNSNTTLYMPKWGRIDVEKGARLYVDGAKITNACEANWYGIFAFGNGNFDQSFNPTTGLDNLHGIVDISKSIIEHAEEAVNNGGGTDNPNTGGVLRIVGNIFRNNRRSIAMCKYENYKVIVNSSNNTSTKVDWPDISYIKENEFTVNDNIRIGFFTHITLWGVKGINLSNNNFFNNQNLNQSHQRAIYTIDATYRLQNTSTPQSMIQGFYTGLESTSFSLTKSTLFPILVVNYNFDANEIGIHFNTVNDLYIRNNTFEIGKKQTPYPTGTGWNYFSLGSKLVYTSRINYDENVHTMSYNPPAAAGYQYTAGTEIYSTGKGDEQIVNNEYNNLKIGNDCADVCGDGNFLGLRYLCNRNVNNKRYDFVLQAKAIVKPEQSNNGIATGNTLSQTNPLPFHWAHISGNLPVDYIYNALNPLEQVVNILNVSPTISTIPSACPLNLPVMPNNSILPEDEGIEDIFDLTFLNNLKNQYYTIENGYDANKDLLQSLLDNGSTTDMLYDIQGNVISQELLTRSKMLAASPYLSEESLRELAMSNSVSNAILFEIIMANPDASKSNDFIELLGNELPIPFPLFMLTLIKQSWEGITARTLLQKNISNSGADLSQLRNRILRGYMLNDTLYNGDSTYVWLSKLENLRSVYQMIEYQMYNRNYSLSNAMMDSLPLKYRMNTKDKIEYDAYKELYNFKKSLLEDSLEINHLDSDRIHLLKSIADAEDKTFPREMARNALCFFYQICYPDTLREMPELSQKGIIPSKSEIENVVVNIYPNPAKDYVILYYNLIDGTEMKELLISDITGKQIYQKTINSKLGQHLWDTRNVVAGNYIYNFVTNIGQKYSGKITIKK